MRISLVAFVRFVAFFTAMFATACGDPNPGPSGPDSGVAIDAQPPPTDSGAVCGSTERSMGAPIRWVCGESSAPGPNGVIVAPEPVTGSLEVGPLPSNNAVCGAKVATAFGWVPWSSLNFYPTTNPDRFYVNLSGSVWYRCSRI